MKTKVLGILHCSPPINGASTVGDLIRQSHIINKEFQFCYINLGTSTHLHQIEKGGIGKILNTLLKMFKVFYRLSVNQVDVCYVTLTASGPGFYKDFLIVSVIKLFRKKVVYHFHGKGVEANSRKAINRLLYKIVFSNSKTILLSERLYPDIQRYVGVCDTYYCPNGILAATDKASKANNVSFPSEAGRCSLLFLSNMMEEKGVYVLLDACRLIQQKGIEFECHFVGAWHDVTENHFVSEVKKRDLNSVVFAHGPVYGEAKEDFFRKTDIFIFPTFYRNETFGLVNLEAMRFGIPIIATPEGGIPDVVQDGVNGFLVESKHHEKLAQKIMALIGDSSLRKTMGAAGQIRFNSFYTATHFEKNFVRTLKMVAGSNLEMNLNKFELAK